MKQIFLLFAFLPFFSFSQEIIQNKDFKVSTSSNFKYIESDKIYSFEKDNQILRIDIDKKSIMLTKYDLETKKELSYNEYPTISKKDLFEKVINLNGNFYFFFSRWDRKSEQESLAYKKINFENGTLGQDTELLMVNGKLSGTKGMVTDWKPGITDKYSFHYSYNGNRLLIQYRKKPEFVNDDISTDIIGMCVYDDELNLVWKEDVEMPYTEAKMNNVDYTIDNNGIVYMLIDVFESSEAKYYIDGKINFHEELLKIKNGELEIFNVSVKDEKYILSNTWLKTDINNNITISGFFIEKNDKKNAMDGVFTIKYDQEVEKIFSSFNKIPLEVINMYETNRTQEKNERKEAKGNIDFKDLDLDLIYYFEDGSVIIVGEQYYRERMRDEENKIYYRKHYDDMLVTKVDVDGSLQWMKKLPKKQYGDYGKGTMSYEYIYKDEKHYFFYVDNINNIDLSIDKEPREHIDNKGGVLSAYTITDNEGEIEKHSILNLRQIPISGSDKTFNGKEFSVNGILETEKGIAFDLLKKPNKTYFIHVDF